MPPSNSSQKRGSVSTPPPGDRSTASPRTRNTNNQALPDESKLQNLKGLVHCHLGSFNALVDQGLSHIVHRLLPTEIPLTDPKTQQKPSQTSSKKSKKSSSSSPSSSSSSSKATEVVSVWFEQLTLGVPMKPNNTDELDIRMFPSECRERGLNYSAPLTGVVCFKAGDRVERINRVLGQVPIMVGSKKCHLYGLRPSQLVKRKEDATELGGYFLCNGIERVIRLLQMPRRNHIMAIHRPSFANRGPGFSAKAVSIRCVDRTESSQALSLHYLNDGRIHARMQINRAEYFIPVMLLLRAVKRPMCTDKEVLVNVIRGFSSTPDGNPDAFGSFISARVEIALREIAALKLFTANQCRAYLGAQFRSALPQVPASASDEAAGQLFLDEYLLIHLEKNDENGKFLLLVEMVRKLYAFVSGRCGVDGSDAVCNQELLLGGQLYGMILKERLERWLAGVRFTVMRDIKLRAKATAKTLLSGSQDAVAYMKRVLEKQQDVGKKLFYFLATGNLVSESGLQLMQTSGFTVVAEKLNRYRYLSHFRAVHRGQFFTEMRTTAVRKLLPESWGFLCPVHTPDGAPCGLLNHLAAPCTAVTHRLSPMLFSPSALTSLLVEHGMLPAPSAGGTEGLVAPKSMFCVMLDGKIVGFAEPGRVGDVLVPMLRRKKAEGLNVSVDGSMLNTGRLVKEVHEEGWIDMEANPVPASLEVCFIPETARGGAYPGLYLFTDPCRMVRPVVNLSTGKVELIGPMAQTFMEIACRPEEVSLKKDTHVETSPAAMLSVIASLTPFSDFNQSPRNMYQCQMGKQTMGTPVHNLKHRPDNKMFRLQTPQCPIVQCRAQADYMIDEYPNGTNAIVAVISYTGYDMEDACILNKASVERGFVHGFVYKTVVVDLTKSKTEIVSNKSTNSSKEKLIDSLDEDGLPHIGQQMPQGKPLVSIVDTATGRARVQKHKPMELGIVETVRVLAVDNGTQGVKKVSLTLRYNRRPIVGDKFASRAGQKGVVSILWPQEDMPFTEAGMTPDLIINPHAFPSRMTIGMLIESMAGKSGALNGVFQDSSPFRLQGDLDGQTAPDYFGKQLRAAGYQYHGTEVMHSGILGTQLECEIYIGVVYYQRLRHMVSDKSQVRSTGPIDALTRQPIKGRSKGGGVRFGEMERDSLLAHGTAFLMQDRLLNCSDRHVAFVCCGSLLSTHRQVEQDDKKVRVFCRLCGRTDGWKCIVIPYVFRYLSNELAAMGIRIHIS